MLLVWVKQSKRKEQEKEKVDDEYPGMELFKGKYICSTLRFELFHSQVLLLMGWNKEKPSIEGNKTSIEAASAPVSVPEVAAFVPGNVAHASAGVTGMSGLMNPNDPAWQMLFASFLQMMSQELMEKLTEQITEKVTHDVAQKMKRDITKSVNPEEVIDLSMVDDEKLENEKTQKNAYENKKQKNKKDEKMENKKEKRLQ